MSGSSDAAGGFDGFHRDWAPFFRELKANNDKPFWEANKQRYLEHVRAPLEALAGELEGAFGPAHFYRPYRDLRFSPDKRPYKAHIGVSFGSRGPSAVGGRYLQLDLGGLFAGGGAYILPPDNLAIYRRAVATEATGSELAAIVADLEVAGYDVEGETLTRVPRGYEADHPRGELLRRKGLYAGRSFEPADWFHTSEVLTRVATVFADVEPLVSWFQRHCSAAD